MTIDTKSAHPAYTIILFYKYTRIEHPEAEMKWQRNICEELGLTGRTILAQEGINATLEGTTEHIEKYVAAMSARGRKNDGSQETEPDFSDIHWKRSVGTGSAFPRLSIKVRKEIVSLHLSEDIDPGQTPAERITPEQLREWFQSGKKFTIVDMRNDYEHKVGHFKDSVLPSLKNFRDLSEKMGEIEHLKDEVVIPVCTGGIRCEKASSYLVREGFNHVYQLDGGIVSYMEKYPGGEFLGTLYTFDNRVTMDFDTPDIHTVVGRCDFCGSPTENFINCHEPSCNAKALCCITCVEEKNGEVYCDGSKEGQHRNSKALRRVA